MTRRRRETAEARLVDGARTVCRSDRRNEEVESTELRVAERVCALGKSEARRAVENERELLDAAGSLAAR